MFTEYEARTSPPADGAPGRSIIRVVDELDLDHVGALDAALLAVLAEADGPTEIVIDLRNCSFCDSSGLSALLRAREAGLRAGHRLTLAAPGHQMLRLLYLTDSAALFPIGSV
ncbi:STAS domain-containing protein [Streptomyces sp. NPDC056387]|uniref:STAS domain-containing protein n=1 Tax=Streptomyces sp. NPDC056387 TaxID=3345803 RepID=UPI0035DA98D2